MNDDEKYERCLNGIEKHQASINRNVDRIPLCKVYATWVEDCKTCPWYNSHLLDYED